MTYSFEIRYQNKRIFSGKGRKDLKFSFRFPISYFSNKNFAKRIYPSSLIVSFCKGLFTRVTSDFYYLRYNYTDDRKMSITCEWTMIKRHRQTSIYKIPACYFRCNAFSQIRGCPSLGTKSHGSISRAKALYAHEISERAMSEFLEAAIRAIKT